MFKKIGSAFRANPYQKRIKDIDPDEIFLDSENLPNFNTNQFEGRIEKSISTGTFVFFGICCAIIFGAYMTKAFFLQVVNGESYFARSENNRLRHTLVFSKRGVIYDRTGERLAWNTTSDSEADFYPRKYTPLSGLSTTLGYLKYPQKDSAGFYYNDVFVGVSGVEKFYNNVLTGENGLKIIEIDARNNVQSESVVRPIQDGKDLTLSLDAELTSHLYGVIAELAGRVRFRGGAGVIMDVHTGEVIALASFPEYNSQILTDGTNRTAIARYINDPAHPFLDRVTDGLYTPGSIVKPFMAVAALSENIIAPTKQILSTGSISIPNPYNPALPTIFRDWKAHGWTDMRRAIAVSSDVYFYAIGGGYEDQKGLGIEKIDAYFKKFGFAEPLPEGFFKSATGTVPTPAWKASMFNGEAWNIGNTYHTSIGQYGFQVTPIQIVRSIASIANGGKLVSPSLLLGGDANAYQKVDVKDEYLQIAREGMRQGVAGGGTAAGLSVPYVAVAAKTGTAELGAQKQFVNSWATGFFPYDNPKYAFAVLMEYGPVANTTGGVYVMRQMLDWMHVHRPEYFE